MIEQIIRNMTTALASDEQFLAWCRDNLGSMPTIAYEPEVPTEGVPDSMYPFVFLYGIKISGPSSMAVELGIGVRNDAAPQTDTVISRVHGAETVVQRETSTGLLLALSMYLQAVDVIHRMNLGSVEPSGETGSTVLHPYYEAWGTIAATWPQTTSRPKGR